MKKVAQKNSVYGKLLEYLNSPESARLGYNPIPTLYGQKLCKYCYNKCNLGEIPRTSIINHLDVVVESNFNFLTHYLVKSKFRL